MDAKIRFSVVCDMMDAILRNKKKPVLKKKFLRIFLNLFKDGKYFSAMRLICPELDKERGTYGLKETQLSKCLVEALDLSKDSADAQKLTNWRKGGEKVGANAGNFALVASEVLLKRQTEVSPGASIKEVNDILDRFAQAEKDQKVAGLRELLSHTNVREMKWIISIVLKDLKVGMSETTILRHFHPDAEDLFNVTCDLKEVCERLTDPLQRFKRQDIEAGKAVRPQLAARVATAEGAWKKMRGKEVVVECKFDGDRIQVHKAGNEIHFFSRTFKDHKEYNVLSQLLIENITEDKCILDGEMMVWDKTSATFVAFGRNQTIAKEEAEGVLSNHQLCYIVFDILYYKDSSVIHRPLRERQQLLLKAVKTRGSKIRDSEPTGGAEPETARAEGVMIKDLESKWDPGDRSAKWLKLKPDYVNTGADLDAIIIGTKPLRPASIGQYLLGLAEKPEGGGHPTRFVSFCRVGNGLSDQDAEHLRSRLKPFLRHNEKNSKPPSFYKVTNHNKERPDLWVAQPQESVILQIRSDVRVIHTEVFAGAYGLRFPRIVEARYDKPWHDCLQEEELIRLVAEGRSGSASGGTKETYSAVGERQNAKKGGTTKLKAGPPELMKSFVVTDVSKVEQSSAIFKGLTFYFVTCPPGVSKEELHRMVAKCGGRFSMNLTQTVTHCVSEHKKGFRFEAASALGDVLHISWLHDCVRQGGLMQPQPKHYLHISAASKERLQQEIDAFGDPYFSDMEEEDLRQIFLNMDVAQTSVEDKQLTHYRAKYCPGTLSSLFTTCRVLMVPPVQSRHPDDGSQAVAACSLQRLAVEVAVMGGTICQEMLPAVTHVVAFSDPDRPLPFQALYNGFPIQSQALLRRVGIHVVRHEWVVRSMEASRLVEEGEFEMRSLDEIRTASPPEKKVQETLVPNPAHTLADADVDPGSIKERPAKRARTSKRDKYLSYLGIQTRRTAAGVQRAVEEKKRKEVVDGRCGRADTGKEFGNEAEGGERAGGSAGADRAQLGGGEEAVVSGENEGGVGGMGVGEGLDYKRRRSRRSGGEAVGMGRGGDGKEDEKMEDAFVDSFLDTLVPSTRRPETSGDGLGTRYRKETEGVQRKEDWRKAGGLVGTEEEGDRGESLGGAGVGSARGQSEMAVGGYDKDDMGLDRKDNESLAEGASFVRRKDNVGEKRADNVPSAGPEGGAKKGKVKVSFKDLVKNLLG